MLGSSWCTQETLSAPCCPGGDCSVVKQAADRACLRLASCRRWLGASSLIHQEVWIRTRRGRRGAGMVLIETDQLLNLELKVH
eukprot:643852-Rhodomonas_salina.1